MWQLTIINTINGSVIEKRNDESPNTLKLHCQNLYRNNYIGFDKEGENWVHRSATLNIECLIENLDGCGYKINEAGRLEVTPRTEELKRDMDRYVVLKRTDIEVCLTEVQKQQLMDIMGSINCGRHINGKKRLKCVVVENDWPIYEQVWKWLEVEAKGNTDKTPSQTAYTEWCSATIDKSHPLNFKTLERFTNGISEEIVEQLNSVQPIDGKQKTPLEEYVEVVRKHPYE